MPILEKEYRPHEVSSEKSRNKQQEQKQQPQILGCEEFHIQSCHMIISNVKISKKKKKYEGMQRNKKA